MKTLKILIPKNIYVNKTLKDGHLGLFSNKDFKENEIVYNYIIRDWIKDKQGNYIDNICLILYDINKKKIYKNIVNKYIHGCLSNTNITEFTGIDLLVNHSCNNNIKYSYKNGHHMTTACKKINNNDELTINYHTFIWDFEEKNYFTCNCNSKCCVGIFKGFKYLNKEIQYKMIKENLVTPYIKEMFYDSLNSSN